MLFVFFLSNTVIDKNNLYDLKNKLSKTCFLVKETLHLTFIKHQKVL